MTATSEDLLGPLGDIHHLEACMLECFEAGVEDLRHA